MITLKRTNSEDTDFKILVLELDEDLAVRDGEDHQFYSQFNKIDNIRFVVIAYDGHDPAGCGAMKEYSEGTMEVKRMFVKPDHRRKGIAEKILTEIESWAAELESSECILETGLKQPEAIGLYIKNGYTRIPNYGQYAGVENSVCFRKNLR